jgi:hypothetical protein
MSETPNNSREATGLIADETAAAARRAREVGLDALAYLLDCARIEALQQAKLYGTEAVDSADQADRA